MTIRQLPEISASSLPKSAQWDTPPSARERWHPEIQSATVQTNTINIYDAIGSDGMGGGTTATRISAALRAIGKQDVTVSLNSPGGNFFEGIAIYNLLREHPAKVTVQVVGLAASAASIIAMAGDDIEIAKSGFLMIHNSWGVVIGNRFDLVAAADQLKQFDAAMASVYADRTETDIKAVQRLMDAETWFTGEEAVQAGFASSLLSADQITEKPTDPTNATLRKIDIALARGGLSRSERRDLIKEITGTPSAATPPVTPSADNLIAALNELHKTIHS